MPLAAAGLVLLLSLTTLAGWFTGNAALAHSSGSLPPMVPLTCAGLALGAVGLFSAATRRARRAGRLCAILLLLCGAFVLGEYALGAGAALDQHLVPRFWLVRFGPGLGRPAPQTGASMALLAGALLSLPRSQRAAVAFGHTVLGLALVALVGLLYAVRPLYGLSVLRGVSPWTALSFAALALGVLFATPHHRAVRLLTDRGPLGILTRRLLLPALLLPLGLGALATLLEHHRLISPVESAALLVVLSTGLLAVQVLLAMRAVEASEVRRRAAERERFLTLAREREARAEARLGEEALRKEDRFLSMMSHELKTPLAALHLRLQMMERDPSGSDGEARRDRIDASLRALDRLEGLVDQLLEAARLSTGRVSLSPREVDLCAVAREVVRRLRLEAAAAGCSLHLEAATSLVGRWDPSRLDQVVASLVRHALRAGRGRPVTVSVERAGPAVRLAVRDRGGGLEPAVVAAIYQPFDRGVAERTWGGLGLGPWIARHVAEALGGRLAVEVHPGEGTSFSVELPLDEPRPVPTPDGGGETPEATGVRH
ncbi:MAG TPA: HAMP domain-containing sensor histidine kinase [Anaeromyxobacteraceae bacterium]|nr:HAMP domain-containing sensor histidine kinase [Anaeromyxobacteraceae bacterium]